MPTCIAALKLDGQCVEAGWPYLDRVPDPKRWTPPGTATPRFQRHAKAEAHAIAAITGELDADRPAVVALLLGERFYAPDSEGRVTPGPADNDTDYHAVLAVGHGRDGAEPYVLVRKSWGADWGIDGHAWVSAPYLTPRFYALASFPSEEIV